MGLNSNPVVLTQEETLSNGVTEKLSKNQLNSEVKEKIFQHNLEEDKNNDDLSQALAIRAEKIAEAKENFFKQVTESDKSKASVIAECSNENVKIEGKVENKAEEIQATKVEKPIEQKVEKPVEQKVEKPVEQKAETEAVKSKESAKGSGCLIC